MSIFKDAVNDKLNLNKEGLHYLEILKRQMKDLKIYLDGDVELMLTDCALNYQLYRDHLRKDLNDPKQNTNKQDTMNHMKAMRYLKVVQDFAKQLGIGPLQRHKLKAFKEINEETLFDKIDSFMEE